MAQDQAPLELVTFVWSHGFGHYVSDHVDHVNQVEQGRRLAGYVAAARADCPGRAIYLVGHSAGCAVVLAAAEALPPGGVERIVLLAPSVAVLGTTATANDRVVADVVDQLARGSSEPLRTYRGSLARSSLRLEVLQLPRPAERSLQPYKASAIPHCVQPRSETVPECAANVQ